MTRREQQRVDLLFARALANVNAIGRDKPDSVREVREDLIRLRRHVQERTQ